MVTVVCPADKKFTKEAAIKSLGSKASRFVVKDVKEAKGKGGKKKEKEKAS